MKKYKTTKDDFKYFVAMCKKWIDKFSLHEIKYYYFHEDDTEDTRASVACDYTGRQVSLFLSKVWNEPVTKQELDYSAFHEVIHSLLNRVVAQTHILYREECIAAEHDIINKLWNGRKN